MSAAERIASQQQAEVDEYNALIARAMEYVDSEQAVPTNLLDGIAKIEARIGVLVTLSMVVS